MYVVEKFKPSDSTHKIPPYQVVTIPHSQILKDSFGDCWNGATLQFYSDSSCDSSISQVLSFECDQEEGDEKKQKDDSFIIPKAK